MRASPLVCDFIEAIRAVARKRLGQFLLALFPRTLAE
jgi:hypothetical protein